MSDEKKIIIDEDWKAQVQAEKEAAAKSPSTGEPASPELSTSKSGGGPTADDANAELPPMPPASFEMLVTTLATETLVALGQVPHPATGKMELHSDQAKYLIDTLDVLRQKTKGNLTPSEQQLLESLLHQLRIVFVEIATRPASAASVTTPSS